MAAMRPDPLMGPVGKPLGMVADDVRRRWARFQQFVTSHNRMFPTSYARFGHSPLVSLDEVIFEDGSTTRGDTVSRSLWD